VCRERDEPTALEIIGVTEQARVIPLDTSLAHHAADLATTHKLAMADAIIYATARQYGAELTTSDSHFQKLPGVSYSAKDRRQSDCRSCAPAGMNQNEDLKQRIYSVSKSR
jgi:predicted nucleic acid-binding protein